MNENLRLRDLVQDRKDELASQVVDIESSDQWANQIVTDIMDNFQLVEIPGSVQELRDLFKLVRATLDLDEEDVTNILLMALDAAGEPLMREKLEIVLNELFGYDAYGSFGSMDDDSGILTRAGFLGAFCQVEYLRAFMHKYVDQPHQSYSTLRDYLLLLTKHAQCSHLSDTLGYLQTHWDEFSYVAFEIARAIPLDHLFRVQLGSGVPFIL